MNNVDRQYVSTVRAQMAFEPQYQANREAMTVPRRQRPTLPLEAALHASEASYFRTGP